MASSIKATARTALFPDGWRAFVHRRAQEAGGAVLIVLALAFGAALVTFDAADPSLNRAVAGPVTNLLGITGAYGADILLQTIGLAAGLISIALAAWGARLVAHHGLTPLWLRLTLLPIGLILAAVGLAALTTPVDWPLRSSLGGVAGSLVLDKAAGLGALFGLDADAIGLAAAVLAAAALVPSLAIGGREWRALVRGARAVGGLGSRVLRRISRMRRREREGAIELRGAMGRAAWRADSDDRAEPYFESDPGAPPAPEAEYPDVPVGLVAPRASTAPVGRRARAARQASLALSPGQSYQAPPLDLLQLPRGGGADSAVNADALAQNARLLESVLEDFGVHGEIVKVRPGPVVALYELEPARGTKSSRVIGLADDIARSMSAASARIAVVSGRNAIGIELPNARREQVYLRELLASDTFERSQNLALALGKDIGGAPVIADLSRMPHLLIAGTTGSGKSVAINTMILSLLYRLTPDECKFIMIDPKMLELSMYDDIPHLMAPVVTDPRKAVVALKWAVREMESRYRLMSQLGVRNIVGYNARLAEARKKGEALSRRVQTGFDAETGRPVFEDQPLDLEAMPLIVVVVDEMADLMMTSGKDIEAAVQRLAQMARAAGIHLIMATQRPSVDVITGTIKANFPTRVSFQVTSKIDSRTILGEQGAEQLLGQGDMLFMAGGGRITRVHGPFVSDDEVEAVVRYLKSQGEPDYVEDITEDPDGGFEDVMDGTGDELYDRAVALVSRERKASTSFVQRHLQIGYNRAARIIEQMESEGVISPANHVGKREVLTHDVG